MPEHKDDSITLSREDEAALEALLGAGMELDAVDPALRTRAERAASVLGLLDGREAGGETLIDVTMARVMRAGRTAEGEPSLVPLDEEALHAWVGAGYRDARVAPSLRERARRHAWLARLVAETRADGAGGADLVETTHIRVQAEIEAESERLTFETRPRAGRGVRLADVVSVAAVLLIGFSVAWPVFTSMRHRAQVTECLGHFGQTASAMGLYAGSNRDQLPMATASLGGGTWWDVNPREPSSNSANLFELARSRYADLSALACPSNRHAPTVLWDADAHDWRSLEEISYSYQIMYGPARPLWSAQDRMVILSDRSPVVLRAYRGEVVHPEANSPNHRAEGQHVLYTDGTAEWMGTPVTEDGNNIWLPHRIERILRQVKSGDRIDLRGTETPDSARDVFLGP